MNEQIRKIAEEARLYAEEQYPGSFVKYDPKWFEFYNEKFVELIARECSQFVEDKFDFCGDELIIAEEIKKHFGVEE